MEARKEAYEAWCQQQDYVSVFQHPRWLDVVAPNWQLAAGEGWWWPYVAERKAGLRVVGLPPCTPYLGPVVDQRFEPTRLPKVLPGVDYLYATTHDAQLVLRSDLPFRAMATQVLDLTADLRYGKTLRWRLNKAAKTLTVRTPIPQDEPGIQALLQAKAAELPRLTRLMLAQLRASGLVQEHVVLDETKLVAWALVATHQQYSFLLGLVRTTNAPPEAGAALVESTAAECRAKGCKTLDLCSGYLPGVRKFYEGFGAKPQFYAQLRTACTLPGKLGEFWRKRTSSRRL